MEKIPTAVEWLVEKFMTENTTREGWHEIFEQAKEMEKRQIMDAFEQGENNSVDYFNPENNIEESEQYYNETYGKVKSKT